MFAKAAAGAVLSFCGSSLFVFLYRRRMHEVDGFDRMFVEEAAAAAAAATTVAAHNFR
jgi:hypothetical protein